MLMPTPVMLISGKVLNSKTNEAISNVKIFFENLDTGKEIGIASSDPNSGNFQIILPSGINYGYLAEKNGFVSINSNIDLSNMQNYKEYMKDIYLTPIEAGQTIIFNNIFFDFDKHELKNTSFFELNRLALLLKNNEIKTIEVAAFTDNKGTEDYNDDLSIKRAESVVNYLISKSGAEKQRIAMKYFGEKNPLASNKTAKGRQINRRVQFKILEK